MSDEQENVSAGSETSGEQADTAQAGVSAEVADTAQADTANAASDESAENAGGAADAESSETSGEQAADPSASRTGYAEPGARTGDPCVCPDGRPGTVNVFAGGLAICLPNQG